MKGTILDFSIQTSEGIISGDAITDTGSPVLNGKRQTRQRADKG